MTDARREWISKRAYALWEAAGRPHGHDGEHWEQAERERDELERVALGAEPDVPARSTKPLIEISGKKSDAARSGKNAAGKAAPKEKAARTAGAGKPA